MVCQGDAVVGNQAHVAPEVLNSLVNLSRGADSVTIDFSGQPVFEAGVLLCEIATCLHPLEGYPRSFVLESVGNITYRFEMACTSLRAVNEELLSAGYPSGFILLIRRMVACDPVRRPSLRQAAEELASLFLPAK